MLQASVLFLITSTLAVCVSAGPIISRSSSLYEERSNGTSVYLARRANQVPTGRHIVRSIKGLKAPAIEALLKTAGLNFLEPESIPLVASVVGEFDAASKAKLDATMANLRDQVKLFVEYEVNTMAVQQQRNAPWGISRVYTGQTHNKDPSQVKKPHKGDKTALGFDFRYEESAGSCATIYIIDSGVFDAHSDFEGRVQWGPVFVKKGKNKNKEDILGHGTQVASIAGGKQFGMAKKVHMVAVKVGNEKTMRGADVILGLDYVAAQHQKDPSRPTIVNLSVGTEQPCELTDLAAKSLVGMGVHVVVAAGNDGQPASQHSPGRVPEVVTVGASTFEDNMWEKSSHGPGVDIFAPGHEVPAASITGRKDNTVMKPSSGTSLAAPHVSGLIAYLSCLNPGTAAVQPAAMAQHLRELALKSADPHLKGAVPADTTNSLILHMPEPRK